MSWLKGVGDGYPNWAVVACLFVCACRGEKHGLEPPPDCEDAKVISCLQRYAYERMRDSDVEQLIEAIDECFSEDLRQRDRQAWACLPLGVGSDREGHALELHYTCDHVCPGDGHIWVRYAQEPGLEECCERDGLTIRSWTARGAYMDCGPSAYFEAWKDRPGLEEYSLCDKL